jgi:hypothetical protein
MEYWPVVICAVICIALVVAYHFGRREGVREANRIAIQRGAWIEVVRPVKCSQGQLPVGFQGIVTGIDKWGRRSVWIAAPWVEIWGKHPQVYLIEELIGLRARPWHSIDADTRDRTLKALAVWEAEMQDLREALLPPGFLEVHRLLDRS